MDKKVIIDKLILLNSHNPGDCEGDLSTLCDINIRLIWDTDIKNVNESINTFNPNDNSIIWDYIRFNFHYLNLLRDSLDNTPSNDVLSVQQTKSLKNVLNNLIAVGIRCNLQPKMPGYRKLPTEYVEDCEPVLNSYNRLTATSYALISYLKCQKLRNVILAGNLKFILSSLYQIIYCPLKKPDLIGVNNKINSFIMTQELYDRFTREKGVFKRELDYLEKSVLKSLYVKETMLLPENNSPPIWFMKAIAENLNNLIRSDKGIETIVWAMIDSSTDYDPNDKAKNWKILDVITKLILNLRTKSDFKAVICKQLIELFDSKDRNGRYIIPFVDLFVLCVKKLFYLDGNLCKSTLLPIILNQFDLFINKKRKFQNGENVTDLIGRIVRVLYSCFVENTAEKLPLILVAPSIPVMVSLYLMVAPFSNKILNEFEDILIKYLIDRENKDKTGFFNLFLFNITEENAEIFRDDIYVEEEGEDLVIKTCDIKNIISIDRRGNLLMKLCKNKTDLSLNLFVYLLNVLIDNQRYLTSLNNPNLLESEDEFVVDETFQKKLVVYRILSELAEDPLIQRYIQEDPIEIIKYLKEALQKALNSGVHKSEDEDSQKFQTIFTLIMILQALIMNSDNYDHFRSLLKVLKPLFRESLNVEFRNLVKGIIDVLEDDKFKGVGVKTTKSELDKALEDVCDSLLPVRGHGLMILSKLIEDKDPEALERKSYILNVFQQNLKEEDSFIYLSSINGLVAMGYLFPDVILNILTDEYSDFSRRNAEDGPELRMKLGEILLRVIKTLGEVAPKYKSLLLNTFLIGTKDEDHLIRASSLSNLGEVCRVLGYKLGTIVVEVLVCVHAVITTDKAIEPRRAAVTVIRQLLVGLEVEMITFLKDHILEIYRTLKRIYELDNDEVMRLQAQLALEQLNENVEGFLMARPRLQADKIFVLPDSETSIKLL